MCEGGHESALVCSLNGQYSGMCGGTSYEQMSNPSRAWKR